MRHLVVFNVWSAMPMKTHCQSAVVPLLLLLFVTGCDPNVTDPPAVGTMDISITGAFQRTFRSGAGFGTGGTGPGGAYNSINVGGGDSIDGLDIEMLGRISAPPASYPLDPRMPPGWNWTGGDTTGNTAVLRHGDDVYIAESGTLTITYAPHHWFASEDHVDGNFDFTAVYWCTGWCRTLPTSFSPDLPRIHVTGQFSATPPPPVPPL
jgi:hypothetical protein